jgi:D-apiose dehydrogenase
MDESEGKPSPVSRPLRIAVVGAGRISKYHFAAWKGAGGVDVVAVCDTDGERAERAAGALPAAKAYASVADLLDREEVDALDIVTPPETHAEVLRLAAARGVDCLCQKPLSRDFAEAAAVVAEVDGKIRLMVNENRRYLPYVRQAREWIAAGLLGDVRQAAMTAFRSSYIVSADGSYAGTPALVAGRRLYVSEALIHQIDCLRAMLGPLTALAARILNTDPGRLDGDTLATIMMETPAGAPVALSGSSVAVGFPERFNDRFEALGARASLTFEDGVLRLLGPEPREERYDMSAAGYAAMYQSCFTTAAVRFRDAIVSGGPFETGGEDNLETLKIAEDAYRLARAPTG